MLEQLKRIRRTILAIEDALMALLLSAMILLAVAQIALRNLFDSGIIWADPSLRIMVLWIALLGALAAAREDRHIRIDLLSHIFKGRGLAYLQAATDLFSAAVCSLIAWHGGRFVWFEWQDGTKLFNGIPAWAGEIIIPIGFGVLTLRFLLNLPLRFHNGEWQ
jgi:TRAP-type C4-dicarboxylate transport system permease small subunit